MNNIDNFDVVIIGAGPAGLTAGYELSKSNKKVLVLEKKNQVGGLAETKVYGDYRYDIGPHRFFTKNEEVYELFLKMLGDDAVKVDRKTRILFKNSYFGNTFFVVFTTSSFYIYNCVHRLISTAKNFTPYSDHITSFFNPNSIVSTHTHRKHLKITAHFIG